MFFLLALYQYPDSFCLLLKLTFIKKNPPKKTEKTIIKSSKLAQSAQQAQRLMDNNCPRPSLHLIPCPIS